MEDDDEFGDLYTDVLRPFSTPAAHQPQPLASSASSVNPPPDLNLHSDDEEILYGSSDPNIKGPPSQTTDQTLVSDRNKPDKDIIRGERIDVASDWKNEDALKDLEENKKKKEVEDRVLDVRVLDSPNVGTAGVSENRDAELLIEGTRSSDSQEPGDKIDGAEVEKDGVLKEKDGSFPGEEIGEKLEIDVGVDDMGSEPIIPGLSTISDSSPLIPGVFDSAENVGDVKAARKDDTGDDWDSDSEGDFQIVLNDTSGPPGMEMNEEVGSEDEDEDGEDLVIVADSDQHHQPIEEQGWGDDSAQAADGDRKEMGEAEKGTGGMINNVGARIGYSNHGFYPHHSQFKYVRPGAAIMPGGANVGPGGAPNQVRPPVNLGPVAGRGRGDWRPIGLKTNTTLQKNFHSGFGLPAWGSNSSGRGFGGGLEFTLPSHKTVFDVDIDSFEEKPWRYPGVDSSDFFNFGLDEEKWKDYCKQLEQLRLEATMQSKIRVYESGRSEQDYDPDMPPELAAAAGIHDVSAENVHNGKVDAGQGDLMGQGRGAARVRPPLPTGRAIQVESGYGERLPSIDTRPPRIRDSDAIIEIVLQDSVDDDSVTADGAVEQPDSDLQREDLNRGSHEVEEDNVPTDTEYFDRFPQSYNGRDREIVERRATSRSSVQSNIREGDGILPFPPEAPLQYRPGSRGRNPIYPSRILGTPNGERWPQERARDRCPPLAGERGNDLAPSESAQGNKSYDSEEKSGEQTGVKQSPDPASPVTVDAVKETSENKDGVHDEVVLSDRRIGLEKEGMNLDELTPTGTPEDTSSLPYIKKQKLSSRVEQPAVHDIDGTDEIRATHSSDNSKARSGSSSYYKKQKDGGDEEVIQDSRSMRQFDMKRHSAKDEISFRKQDRHSRDGKQEVDRNHAIVKGRDDSNHSYPRRESVTDLANYPRTKTEGIERSKERDNSLGLWHKRDDDMHGRRFKDENMRKRERVEETESKHRSKIRENERSDVDEYLHSRKPLDNGDWRIRHDKDVGPRRRERDDSLTSRHENLDDLHAKRRKDEEHKRREHADKEEILHGYRAREDTSRRKRERDDVLDQRRRDDQPRVRDKPDDHHSLRHREESWRQRERDERQRLKQSHEDNLSKREREEGRGPVRSGRGVEDKQWVGSTRAKDDRKSSDKDYQLKDKRRHSEQNKRRDRVEDETHSQRRGHEDVHAHENQFSNEERSSRPERSSGHSDRVLNTSDSKWMYKERHKVNQRCKESEGGDQLNLGLNKRKQEDHGSHQNEKISTKFRNEKDTGDALTSGPSDARDNLQLRSSSAAVSKKNHLENDIQQQNYSSRKHREDAHSGNEQQDSRKGRSKLERWTSHKDKDDNTNVQSTTSSSKAKDTEKNNDESPLANEQPDESTKMAEVVDNQHPVGNASDPEIKDADMAPVPVSKNVDSDKIDEDRHLDTFTKLKKRSERFKLPMPSEKEVAANRKLDVEALQSVQSETTAETEIKQERPARKRRWISN